MKAWNEILLWIETNRSAFLDVPKFNQGALPEDIEVFKLKFAFLTSDIIDFYREVDGQNDDEHIYDGWRMLSISSVIESYDELYKINHDDPETQKIHDEYADGSVKGMYWNKKWIPFLGAAEGSIYFFDFDPAEGGNLGQIIYAPNDDPERKVVAKSLDEFWCNFKNRLYDGSYDIYDDMIMLSED